MIWSSPLSDERYIFENDIGVVLTATVLDSAGVPYAIGVGQKVYFIFSRASGTPLKVEAVVDDQGTYPGQCHYVTVEGDLTPDGDWGWQTLITETGVTVLHTSIQKFKVHENLPES